MGILKDRYINPFTDYGFKKLFGTEFNKPILMDFLNELISNEAGVITDLTFLSSEQLGRSPFDRRAVFDIHCKNEAGDYFIVEIQKAKQNYFKDRSVFYSTFPIQQQAEKGDWDFQLKAVYTIGILDFVFDEDKNDPEVFHHEVKMVDIKTNTIFYNKLTYIYLEMPKFNKSEEELETHFEKWLFVLKNLHNLIDKPKKFQEKIFAQLFQQAEIAQFNPREFEEYEDSLKVYRDLKNVKDTAFDDGKIEGKIEGIREGEIKSKIETARQMKADGLPYETIRKYTNLSLDLIEKLEVR